MPNLLWNACQLALFLKNIIFFIPLNYEVFSAKYQKNFKAGKIGKLADEKVLSQKKGFHLFKSLLYDNVEAQNMQVVAGRLH